MRKKIIWFVISISFLGILLFSVTSCMSSENTEAGKEYMDQIRQGFVNPPDNCRPEVLWDWMGGLISKKGISADLESMAKAGIGGVMIMQMPDQCPYPRRWSYRDYPGKIKCLSDEWFQMINYAIGECDRLGMDFSIFMCPGWSHCGAPWITPERGLKKLVTADTVIEGPAFYNSILHRAPALPGTEGGNMAPEWSSDFKKQPHVSEPFYRDVVMLALPLSENEIIPYNNILDLTKKMTGEGNLVWNVPEGSWRLMRIGMASENGMNHPAPIEATGLECDRMDPDAVQMVFDGIVGRIQREAKARGYRSFKRFETDSYEAGFQDFGRDFPEEFQRRRGYDCSPWLPAWMDRKLIISSADQTRRFLNDMQQTINELWTERFHETLRSLGDSNDLEWAIEPYFLLQIDWRTSGARSVRPGNEFWVDGSLMGENSTLGPAPGIAALYGRDVVWAEAFTAEPDKSAWRNDPWLLKISGDRAFCDGINHFVMHGFAHNPFDDRYRPGLTMGYWGTQFNRHVTWWPLSQGWHRYLSRCQYLLRQGLPVIDGLEYPQKLEHLPEEFGYVGDYRKVTLNDESLMNSLSVKDGKIMLPNGNSFAALILNPGQAIRPEALNRIRDLVKAGATLIGEPPPALSPSLENYPEADKLLKNTIDGLWNKNFPGKGKVLTGQPAEKHLQDLLGGPGFICDANSGDTTLVRAMQRRIGKTDFWFLAYSGDQRLKTKLRFLVNGRIPEFWDPITGETRILPEFTREDSYTVIPFEFLPRQSGFVVFAYDNKTSVTVSKGKNNPDENILINIRGPWQVNFDPSLGGPGQPVRFEELEDWTSRPEKDIRYYSGVAVYQTQFDVPAISKNGTTQKLQICLGKVKNVAQVNLNGKDLGTVWCAPWHADVPAGLLKEKGNLLQIKVANTWVNRLIGDEQEPEDCELAGPDMWFSSVQQEGQRMGGYNNETAGRALKDLPVWLLNGQPRPSQGRYTFTSWRYYDRYAPLLPSGLFGPVSLLQK